MKTSDQWVRAEDVARGVDIVLAENGGDLNKVIPYRVAMALDTTSNNCLKKKVHAEVARRRGGSGVATEPLPVDLRTAIGNLIASMEEKLVEGVTAQYSEFTSRITQGAAQQSAVDAQRFAELECAHDALSDHCDEVEEELDAARSELAAQKKTIAELTIENLRLQGKVEGMAQLAGRGPQSEVPIKAVGEAMPCDEPQADASDDSSPAAPADGEAVIPCDVVGPALGDEEPGSPLQPAT